MSYGDWAAKSERIADLESKLGYLQAELDAVLQLGVDKWLEGDELNENPATRAGRAREKTLRLIEDLDSRLAEAERERDELRRAFTTEQSCGHLSALRVLNDAEQEVCCACWLTAVEKKQQVLICIHCGNETAKPQPWSAQRAAELIADHLMQCPTHPLVQLTALREAVKPLIAQADSNLDHAEIKKYTDDEIYGLELTVAECRALLSAYQPEEKEQER